MLFLTEDNSFRGEDTSISLDEVVEATKVLSLKALSSLPSQDSQHTCHAKILFSRSYPAAFS